jgi:hypothetical protein
MFFDLAKSLRSLTRSPIHSVIHEAHRFARHHLESGGNVTPHNTIGDQDFVLPPDVSASAVTSAIEDRLRGQRFSSRKRGIDAVPPLQTNADGKVVVTAELMLALGDGEIDRGRRVVERIVSEIRHHRMLGRLPTRSALPGMR